MPGERRDTPQGGQGKKEIFGRLKTWKREKGRLSSWTSKRKGELTSKWACLAEQRKLGGKEDKRAWVRWWPAPSLSLQNAILILLASKSGEIWVYGWCHRQCSSEGLRQRCAWWTWGWGGGDLAWRNHTSSRQRNHCRGFMLRSLNPQLPNLETSFSPRCK